MRAVGKCFRPLYFLIFYYFIWFRPLVRNRAYYKLEQAKTSTLWAILNFRGHFEVLFTKVLLSIYMPIVTCLSQ